MKRCIWLLTLVLVLVAGPASAGCDFDSTDPRCLCNHEAIQPSALLPAVQQEAVRVRMRLCLQNGTEQEVFRALATAVRDTSGWMDPFGGFADGLNLNQMLLEEDFPALGPPLDGPRWLEDRLYFSPHNLAQCDMHAHSLEPGNKCNDVFMEFHALYSYALDTLAKFDEVATLVALTELSTSWDKFLRQSRGQTPLELWFNTRSYHARRAQQFSPPPDRQWILLHPMLVMEHLSAAEEGSRTKAGLAIEVAGVNFWRQRAWYRPTGGSVIASYTDRPGVNGWAYGAMVHFGNAYSIGVTSRSGDLGILASLDFVKLIQDKNAVLDRYTNP